MIRSVQRQPARFTEMVGPEFLVLQLCLLALRAFAQPAPAQQARITAAIKSASSTPVTDWTAFVNPFIGTGTVILELLDFILLILSCR
jgi:hypothetical protein